MQDQGIDEQRVVNTGLLPIARDLGLPLVCTNDVHYLRQTDRHPHDVLLCIGTGKNVSDEKRLRYHGDQFFLKTADEMRQVFGDYPDALSNTLLIAERCNVMLPKGQAHLPDFQVPRRLHARLLFRARSSPKGSRSGWCASGRSRPRGELRRPLAEYHTRLSVRDRPHQTDEVPGYFLIVWDFIRYARERGIPVGPGRGSSAGSLVAYSLRITDVDPLHFDLYFERFLNPERVTLPDIDVDFCERRRGEVISYVSEKYGRDNVAQIITFGTMKARAVVRDVGRVMEMPISDVDRVAKLIPNQLDMTLDKAVEENPALAELDKRDERVHELLAGRAPARRHHAPRLGACRGRRHRAQAAHRVRPALPQPEGRRRNHDAVGDEGNRPHRPAQDGLPRPEHAHAARRRGQAHQGDDRRRRSTSTGCRWTTRRRIRSFRPARRTACSSSKARACVTRFERRSRSASKTSSR